VAVTDEDGRNAHKPITSAGRQGPFCIDEFFVATMVTRVLMSFSLAASRIQAIGVIAANNDSALREKALLGDRMGIVIPAGRQKLRHNEFSARIGFGGHGSDRSLRSTGEMTLVGKGKLFPCRGRLLILGFATS
jgi:hypothetical protein